MQSSKHIKEVQALQLSKIITLQLLYETEFYAVAVAGVQ